jgi:hypothetical protein
MQTREKRPSPTTGTNSKRGFSKELCVADWPLSVKVSVKWRVQAQLATILRQFAETRRRHANTLFPDWFIIQNQRMKTRFILFRRGGIYYSEDTASGKQHSLRTKDEGEALTLLHSKNEAHRQPGLNLQIARTYLTATDSEVAKRTWQISMDETTKTKTGSTLSRYQRAMEDQAFDITAICPSLRRIRHISSKFWKLAL